MVLKRQLSKEKIINFGLNTLIALFSLILLISIYTGVQIKILNYDYANFFGYSMFEVQTKSMEEAISAGDWIIVKLDSKIKLKDVITYKLDKDYITHRVVEIHNGTYITQGDANSGKDDPIDQSQVVGKVVKVLPGFGILRKTLFNPSVLIMLIIILYLIDSLSKDSSKSSKTNEKVKNISLTIWHKLNKTKATDKKEKNNEILPELNPNKINEDAIIVTEENNDDIVILNESEESKENIKSEIIEITMPESSEEIEALEEPIEMELDSEEELSDYDYVADELEKTQFFRIIPVDEGELDSTLLEIANYEMLDQNKEQKEMKEEKIVIEDLDIEEDDSLTKIDLDLIKNNTRRNKNLIDAMMNVKKDEINEVINILLNNDKVNTNEPTIKNIFITTYVHARYYNYYSEKDIEYRGKNLLTKIEKILEIISNEMIEEYNGADNKYAEKVNKYLDILKIVAQINQGKDSISEIKTKREFYRNVILNYCKELSSNDLEIMTNNIIKTQKTYEDISKYFLKKFESNAFYLDINKINNKKDLHTVEIEHNIPFSKIYSDYIIDKTYSEGIIAEDKTSVLFILLLSQIIKDMINTDFNKKYVINISSSLFSKEKKLVGLLNAIDDEYAKSHILFLIDLQNIANNKKIIQRFRKSGFRFALGFKSVENLQSKDRSCLYMTEVIFVNKKEEILEVIENYIPEDLQDKIIYDDIYDKFNNIEGE